MVLTEKRLAFKPEIAAWGFGCVKDASHLNWAISPRISALTEKRLALQLGNIARNFGPGRKAHRIQTAKDCQEFWFCPKRASYLQWEPPPGISVLTDKRLALKLVTIDRNFGSDRQTPRIQSGKHCQEFWLWPENTSHQTGKYRQEIRPWPRNAAHLNWDISPGTLAPTEKRLEFKRGLAGRGSGSDRKTPRM